MRRHLTPSEIGRLSPLSRRSGSSSPARLDAAATSLHAGAESRVFTRRTMGFTFLGPRTCAALSCVRAKLARFRPSPAERRGSRRHAQAFSPLLPSCQQAHVGDEGCEFHGILRPVPGRRTFWFSRDFAHPGGEDRSIATLTFNSQRSTLVASICARSARANSERRKRAMPDQRTDLPDGAGNASRTRQARRRVKSATPPMVMNDPTLAIWL